MKQSNNFFFFSDFIIELSFFFFKLSDFSIVGAKLNEFLNEFVLSYQDLINQKDFQINLDKIYGDCSQILLNLFEMVEK